MCLENKKTGPWPGRSLSTASYCLFRVEPPVQRWKTAEGAQAPHPLLLSGSVFAHMSSDSLSPPPSPPPPESMLSFQTVCSQLRFEAGSVDAIPPYVPCLVRCESLLMCTPNLGLNMCTCRFLRSWRSLSYFLLSQGRACPTLRKSGVCGRKNGTLFAFKCECLSDNLPQPGHPLLGT